MCLAPIFLPQLAGNRSFFPFHRQLFIYFDSLTGNNLFFILLDQEKSEVLSSEKSKDLEIGSSTGKELYRLFV